MTLDKFFDEINETDLQQIIGNKAPGCKAIEYRESLPDDSFEHQKDFLAEVSSFANTVGGHLIYGVIEQNGIPIALPGISSKDPEREILRLEKLLKDNLQPKCQGVLTRVIHRSSEPPIVLIHVPESLSKPHVVNFQGHWRFYARNATGKFPLGVTELKSAFLATAGLGERIRSFHFERLNKISSGKAPVPLLGKARTVFHLIPYSAFECSSSLSLTTMEDIWSIPLVYRSASSYRTNLDGVIVYSDRCSSNSGGYTQVFRNGIIESVSASLFGSGAEGSHVPDMAFETFETDVVNFLSDCLAFYRKLSVRMPAALFLSLLGWGEYKLAMHQLLDAWHSDGIRLDDDAFLFPEVILENSAVNSAAMLKPIFRAIWNATGWEQLYEYAENGEKKLMFPGGKFAGEQVRVARGVKTPPMPQAA